MKKLLFTLLISLVSIPSFSQQSDLKLELQPVVVTATRSEISLEDSPIPTEVITQKEIQQLNLITVKDLLEVKGYFVAPLKSGGFQIRGLSSEYVLVLVDGVNLAGRVAGALDVSNINLANVERVEVVKGSMSSLWGNHAIGGVINIITKKPTEPATSLIAQYGTNNSYTISALNSVGKGGIKNSTQISYGGSDGFDIDEDLPGKNVLPNTLLNFTNRTSYELNTENELSLSVQYFNKESKGATITETNTEGQLVPVFEDNSNENLVLDLEYETFSLGRLISQAKLSNSYFSNNNKSTFVYFGQKVEQVDKSNQSILQAESINSYNWSTNQQTVFGFGYKTHSYETERYGGNRELNSFFSYLQHRIKIGELNVIGGGRYDSYSEFGTNLSPKVSAKYNLGNFGISSSVGYGFRVPDFRTLFINYGGFSQGFYVLGANNIQSEIQFYQNQGLLPFLFYDLESITELKPETSTSYDFGIDYKPNSNSKFGVRVFQTDSKDLIESVLVGIFTNRTLLFGYTNISNSTFRGVEASSLLNYEQFRFDMNYQYLEAEAEKEDGTEFFLSERPEHLLNLSLTFTPSYSDGVSLNVNGTIKSKYFFRDANTNGIKDIDEYVNSHSLLNAFMNRRYNGISVGFGVNNILDFTDKEYLKFQNGRTFYTKVTYNF